MMTMIMQRTTTRCCVPHSIATLNSLLLRNDKPLLSQSSRPFSTLSLLAQQQQTQSSNGGSNVDAPTSNVEQKQQLSQPQPQPVKIIKHHPGTTQNPMKETKTKEGFRNALFESEDEKSMVKRGAIFSLTFALLLWLGTYYRAYLMQTNRGTLWLPAIFVYAHNEQSLFAQHYFGKTSYSNDWGVDEMQDKEQRVQRLKQLEQEYSDVPEL